MAVQLRRYTKIIVLMIFVFEVFLLLSGYRILIYQRSYSEEVGGFHGIALDIEGITRDKLDCTYFTGRSFQTMPGIEIFDECPFVYKPKYL